MTWKEMASRSKVLLTFVRYRHRSKHWEVDAAKYGYVKYYKRHEDHVDPPITPSKILMIRRVLPFKGNPWWEKDVLTKLGLEEKRGPVFVKNTPESCQLLWGIKHLIEVIPVELPNQMKDFNDSVEYHVDEYGTVHVCGKIDPVRQKAAEDYKCSLKRLSSDTISEKLRLQWIKGSLI